MKRTCKAVWHDRNEIGVAFVPETAPEKAAASSVSQDNTDSSVLERVQALEAEVAALKAIVNNAKNSSADLPH